MRKYGEQKLARCAAAERVLAHAVAEDGCLVAGARLLHYWPAVHEGALPREVEEARWERLLAPAVEAGRVRRVKSGTGYCYGPADRPDMEPSAGRFARTFGRAALSRSLKAEQALRRAVEEAGVMVPGRLIEESWKALHLGLPSLPRFSETAIFLEILTSEGEMGIPDVEFKQGAWGSRRCA